ncbi:deoxyguanylate kinase / guanylate kinase [Aliarcobacter butzleri 7h1h]|uniref:Guanylate kinase n=1 Tax=Aliarcobacter butzleri L352 TaxID=1447260 RepID=A0A837JBJ1_9BACT|nr:guanylate kinase [Aliarcobacter butzleri]AGR76873.1 deoxyguanylate kinase / guanylate kinase [Aliarcobacter butzleri 7h1h]KLE03948.1 guanylate kinase [Aliarcobacter butzleri L352]KLE09662.1 guanylate kinase [Aliarcobacter butzleri L354]MCG3695703.1 guanylate kinase [Aliarcobacter butzleri]MCT7585236.1 guanylate kinase [Aliarcobacter butzleri]
MNDKKGAILIISGPSGCGKSTLLKEVYKNISDYYFSISTTTREPRVGEVNGVDYFFVSKEEFEEDIKNGNFLEYAKVHDNYYGTSLKPIIQALNEGKLIIFDIDVQGHHLVRKKMNDSVTSVFITTPSLKVLEERLNNRNSDSLEVIEKRVKNAKKEIEFFDEYDYFIVNDNLESASNELVSIANIARAKAKLFDKEKIVSNWLN